MTEARRRLVALAAALAPGRARALLDRLGDADGPAAAALTATLAAAPRRTRLVALAVALPSPPSPDAGHPLLARLRLEAAAHAPERPGARRPLAPARSAGRTEVRAATGAGAADAAIPA